MIHVLYRATTNADYYYQYAIVLRRENLSCCQLHYEDDGPFVLSSLCGVFPEHRDDMQHTL